MISVIIPCYNESAHIGIALDSLIRQQGLDDELEILIADGMSTDGTREILAGYARNHSFISVLDNPARKTPAALKLLLERAKGEYIIRADAHCEYPSDYLMALIGYLRQTGADNVGGVWETVPGAQTATGRAIASCLNSKFGVGISYRTRDDSVPIKVETVPFGAWRSDHFEKYGPFDDAFVRAQDLEHNIRVVKAGGTILCLPWLKIRYFARDTFPKLYRMAFQYGYWKIPVMLKHRIRFSLRQFGPAVLVITSVICGLLAFFKPIFLIPIGSYAILTLVISLITARKNRLLCYFPLFMYAFFIIHYGYGFGYLRGIFDACKGRLGGFSDLSR